MSSNDRDAKVAALQHEMSHMPQYENMTVGRYLSTRVSSLKPPMTKLQNPITLLRMLNTQQWLFFFVAFAGWTWDAFDFFTVSLTVSQLAAQFKVSTTDITWGITLVLMFRSVGSIIFGVWADRYANILANVLFTSLTSLELWAQMAVLF